MGVSIEFYFIYLWALMQLIKNELGIVQEKHKNGNTQNQKETTYYRKITVM
jgi:hypothetical protein